MFAEKWMKIISETLQNLTSCNDRFPKDVVNIIFQYSLVPARQQYIDKYSRPQLFRALCFKKVMREYYGGRLEEGEELDSSCEHKMIGKVNSDGVVDKRQFPKRCKRNKHMLLSWQSTEFYRHHCRDCKDENSYILHPGVKSERDTRVPGERREYKGKHDYNTPFQGCLKCGLIEFCPLAQKDDQICLMDYWCHLCEQNICSHQVYKQIAPKVLICVHCNDALTLGRKLKLELLTKV
jgi:hypothetical protein